MHATRAYPRSSCNGAPPCLPTVPVRRYWRLWLLVGFFLATLLVAALAPAAHASARPIADVPVATSAGQPMAPGGQAMHMPAMAEADAEAPGSARPAQAWSAHWPARHAPRLASPRLPPSVPATPGARTYRSPPAHAPPASRHG